MNGDISNPVKINRKIIQVSKNSSIASYTRKADFHIIRAKQFRKKLYKIKTKSRSNYENNTLVASRGSFPFPIYMKFHNNILFFKYQILPTYQISTHFDHKISLVSFWLPLVTPLHRPTSFKTNLIHDLNIYSYLSSFSPFEFDL